MDCGEGKVWFRVCDSPDFSVSQQGVVSTLRHLNLVGQEEVEVVVYAQDLQSKQLWKVTVHLHICPNSSTAAQQVCTNTKTVRVGHKGGIIVG